MSRRGNCHDNAVPERTFNLLKHERIRRRTYRARKEARQDVCDDIEMFCNPKRKHARNRVLSPAKFERQQRMRRESIEETRSYSELLHRLSVSFIDQLRHRKLAGSINSDKEIELPFRRSRLSNVYMKNRSKSA